MNSMKSTVISFQVQNGSKWSIFSTLWARFDLGVWGWTWKDDQD